MKELRAEAVAELTAPGAPWEIVDEDVLGERLPVFARRARSLRELVERSTKYGDREYLVLDDWRITFDDHLPMVASLAAALRDDYGVGAGDRVAIWAENRPEWAIAFWATVSLGAIAVACNGWWTADELTYAIGHSTPTVLIADARRLDRVDRDALGVPVIEMERDLPALIASTDTPMPDTAIAEDDAALILYTSGTTGRPKGALISHRALIGFVQVNGCNAAIGGAMAKRFGVDLPAASHNIVLLTSPMFHVSGLFAGIITAAAVGDTLITRTGRFDPDDVLRLIERERVTQWTPLGAMGPRVLEAMERTTYDVSSVKQLGFGGAPLSPTLRVRLRDAFNIVGRLGMGYGSSETVAVVTSIGGPEFDQFPTASGRLLPTVALEIRDRDTGEVLPDATEGAIHVRSAYIMLGYWDDEAATAKSIAPGRWLDTGDIGHMDDGMLFINSRASEMILRSGENVYPAEIEHRLVAHPGVADAAVLGVDDEILGQDIKAVVVPVSGATLHTDELAAWCAETLAKYKVPAVWEVRVEPLPRNAAGKILKHELR
jgi:acyl-CoA synthetase (AMP-forming)/AMP-acid ligase II